MSGRENDGPNEPEPDYVSTFNPLNPFQKIRSIEDAADAAKIGAMVPVWMVLTRALRLGELSNMELPTGAEYVTFTLRVAVNAGLLLFSLLLIWVILQKQSLWAVTIVLIFSVIPILMAAVSGGGFGLLSLALLVIALMSFRGALAMRRFRKQEAGPPAEG